MRVVRRSSSLCLRARDPLGTAGAPDAVAPRVASREARPIADRASSRPMRHLSTVRGHETRLRDMRIFFALPKPRIHRGSRVPGARASIDWAGSALGAAPIDTIFPRPLTEERLEDRLIPFAARPAANRDGIRRSTSAFRPLMASRWKGIHTTTRRVGAISPNPRRHRMHQDGDRAASSVHAPDEDAAHKISGHLRTTLGTQRYRLWFDGGASVRVDGDDVRVEATTQFVADWLGRNLRSELESAARAALGAQARVRFGVAGPPKGRPGDAADDDASRRARARLAHAAGTTPSARIPAGLGADTDAAPTRRPEWRRLDDFVIGDSNRVAFDASRRVAEAAACDIPNLFVHGGVGLGKTHLLQGICQRRRERHPRERIRYTTGEQFTNEYIAAVRSSSLEGFRAKMRRLDLLCIDDVHFIANKSATQNEFMHTMDAIDRVGRVVLASDEHPRQIRKVSEGLLSRFMAGAVVRIDAPDRATRVALIERLAASRGLRVTPEGADAIAGACVASVREIEGALARLAAVLMVESDGRTEISAGTVARVLHNDRLQPRRGPLRPDDIVEAVSKRLDVDRAQLANGGRHRRVILARGLAVYLIRELTTLSFPEIARLFGREGHSSALGADRRLRRLLQEDEGVADAPGGPISLRELVDRLRHALVQGAEGTMPR